MSISLLIFAITSSVAQGDLKTYDVNGLSRTAIVFAPTQKTAHPPLVFGFHGHGGNGRQASRSFRIHEFWPEAVVVYMNGIPTITGNDRLGTRPGWQVATGLFQDRDLKFFDAVYKGVTKEFSVDKKAVFTMGHSNGGRFTQLLWAERNSLFAAYGPSGSYTARLKLSPKPVFHVLGEKDPLVDPEKQRETIESMKEMNGCEGNGESLATYTTKFKGKNGNDVVTFIHPGGHEYPRAVPELLVSFFKSVMASK